ncbi:gamma-aminobutyric acid type B receptor subunit 1-like isoform X2 [Saccostrea echinata]|uniref:gamma-aminobutyric acid type B receptor subunit 1-like isoform X2 n=1 Tax=Saccostrea echinata TaxID=191078 RepID=UPI002A7EBD0F|nr:gamma-aminobutyric acid type B receptor subunit 1-like isoform X2 [Saccostrea echinata]
MFLILLSILTGFYKPLLGLKSKNLTIGVLVPMTGSWSGGKACKPALEMALERVNRDPRILPEYHLNMEVSDSQCKPGVGTSLFYDFLYSEPPKMMVLSGCSVVSTFISQAAKLWNIIVLGYGSSSPSLSDRRRFPSFFRTHPSATLHNPARIKIFQKFGWSRIATIRQKEEVFSSTEEDLVKRIKAAGMEIVTRQEFLSNPSNAVANLKRRDARIIVGMFYENLARKVFCEAYKNKLYGKRYVWFLVGWYPDKWYEKPDPEVDCIPVQLKLALEGHFTTEAEIIHQDRLARTVSGMTSAEFKTELDRRLNYRTDVSGYPEAPLAFDAIWALALALNKTEKNLQNFQYSREDISQKIYSSMNATHFLGVSGIVAFSSEGDRIAWTMVEQMTNGTYNTLGCYHQMSDNLSWLGVERWIGGHPPPDHTRIITSPKVIPSNVFLTFTLLAGGGVCFGIFCCIFTFLNRYRMCIVDSQPVMNVLVILGCIISLMAVPLFGLDQNYISPETFTVICQLRAWCLLAGFSVGYGALFSKVWMVHRINTKTKGKTINSSELYAVFILIQTINVIILTSLQIKDPLFRQLLIFDLEVPTNTDEDIKLRPQLEFCDAKQMSIWLGVTLGFNGVILLFGIFLAFETRSVKLQNYKDSRSVAIAIYNIMVLVSISLPLCFIISKQHVAKYAFVAGCVLLSCYLSMGFLFLPKILVIMRSTESARDVRFLEDNQTQDGEECSLHQSLESENEDLKISIQQIENKLVVLNRQLIQKSYQRVYLSVRQRENRAYMISRLNSDEDNSC